MSAPRNKTSLHAYRRGFERHGVYVRYGDVKRQMDAGTALIYQRGRDGEIKAFCQFGRKMVPLIWEPSRKVVITVLPHDSTEATWGRKKLAAKGVWPSACCVNCGRPVARHNQLLTWLGLSSFHVCQKP